MQHNMILRLLVVALAASLLSSNAPCCTASSRGLLQDDGGGGGGGGGDGGGGGGGGSYSGDSGSGGGGGGSYDSGVSTGGGYSGAGSTPTVNEPLSTPAVPEQQEAAPAAPDALSQPSPDTPAPPQSPSGSSTDQPASSGTSSDMAGSGSTPQDTGSSQGMIAPQLTTPADDVGNSPGTTPSTAEAQPVQPAANPDAPPQLDPDAANLPPTPAPAADPAPAENPASPPDPVALVVIIVDTPAGGVAFLYGQQLWWFYTDTVTRQPVRGYWTRGCLGCGFFRTQDGRVRCPTGAFLSGGSCRQLRTDQAPAPGSGARAATPYVPPTIAGSSWGQLSCAGCTSQAAPSSPQAPAHKPLNLTELPVPAALAGLYGLALNMTQPPEGGTAFAYRGRTWWYFSSSAASGGSLTTYGFWEDSKRMCFGCGYFYPYNTGIAACPMGYFLDPQKLSTCTKPASTRS